MGGQVVNNTKVQMIAVAEIDFGQRLRRADPEAVNSLKADIAHRGLRSPIEVMKSGRKAGGFVLVSGAHRLTAVEALGWAEVPAFILTGTVADRRRDEILENLAVSDLSALDRCVFVHEWKTLWEAENADKASKRGGDRRSEEYQTASFAVWSDVVSQRTGLSDRTLRMISSIGEKLTVDARRALEFTPLAHSQKELQALTALGADVQLSVSKLIASGQSATVKAAMQVLTPDVEGDAEPAMRAALVRLLNAWSKADDTIKTSFLEQIGATFIMGEAE